MPRLGDRPYPDSYEWVRCGKTVSATCHEGVFTIKDMAPHSARLLLCQ